MLKLFVIFVVSDFCIHAAKIPLPLEYNNSNGSLSFTTTEIPYTSDYPSFPSIDNGVTHNFEEDVTEKTAVNLTQILQGTKTKNDEKENGTELGREAIFNEGGDVTTEEDVKKENLGVTEMEKEQTTLSQKLEGTQEYPIEEELPTENPGPVERIEGEISLPNAIKKGEELGVEAKTEIGLKNIENTEKTEEEKEEEEEEEEEEEGVTTDEKQGSSETTTKINVVDKSISDSGSKDQELDKKVINGPSVKTQSVKTKANWTTSVLNGEPVYTDISVYQSHGRNYQFRIPGALPKELPGGLIAWIRENSDRYPQTDINYTEFGTDVEKHTGPPTELPNRCGLTFLKKLSGGKASPIEENPWQVAVLRRVSQLYICGATVITRRHILSAAHCFRRKKTYYDPGDIILRVGDYDKEVREEYQLDYDVVHLVLHEGYHEKRHLHDIALLTTNEDIPFSSHIYPICLPPPWADYTPGLNCTVSGWGQVGNDEVPTRYLRSGQVSVVSKEDCRKKTIFSRGVPPEIFCAEDPTKQGIDTCLGDSGGPFACKQNDTYYLYGITAFGSYPCGQDIPSFYTKVSFYKLWILHKLSQSKNDTTVT